MANENDMKKELLKQLEVESSKDAESDVDSAKVIIQQHNRKLKLLRYFTIASWIITGAYILVSFNLKEYFLRNNYEAFLTRNEFWFLRYSDMVTKVLVAASLLLTYLVYHQSKTLTMLKISARLANIEQYLKKISQKVIM